MTNHKPLQFKEHGVLTCKGATRQPAGDATAAAPRQREPDRDTLGVATFTSQLRQSIR